MSKELKPLVTLNDHLSAWYLSSVRKIGGSPVSVVDHFKKLAEENPKLMKEAKDMLESMRGISDEKCFITKTYKSFLNKVLN